MSIPLGIKLGQAVCADRTSSYKFFILIITFFTYTCYHLSRKPISVVKPVLHQNCTQNATNCSSWPPFDKENFSELLGSLDYVYLFAYAVGMFFSGHIAERMDLRYFLTGGMLLSGVFTILFGLGKTFNIHMLWFYLGVQLLGGLVQSTGWPSVVTVMANWYGKGKRGFIMGVWNSHTSVGNILGSLIAGAFVTTNWAFSFIIPGVIISVMGLIVFFFLVPNPETVDCDKPDHNASSFGNTSSVQAATFSSSSEDEEEETRQQVDYLSIPRTHAGIPAGGETEVLIKPLPIQDSEEPVKAINFFSALKIPGVLEFSFCLFFAKLVSYTFLYWLPKYIDHTVHKAQLSADLSTLFDAGGIVGGITAGVVSDITGARASTCIVMLIVAAPVLFIYQAFGSTSGYATFIFLLLVCGALVNGPYALITTAVSADLGTHPCLQGSAKALATVTAIIDGTGSMGAALGPLFAGLILPSGWNNVFYMLIAADLMAALLLIRLVVREVKGCCRR